MLDGSNEFAGLVDTVPDFKGEIPPKKQFWRAKVPASLVRSDRGTAATKPPFPVPCGIRCQFLANAGERFAQGCVLALTLFNLLCQWPSCHT